MKKIFGFTVLLFTMSVHAEDKSSGCGLGWKVAPQNSLISSYTRSLTNITTTSTLAMTSGTSGCDKHSVVDRSKMEIHYAEANYHELMVEGSRGQGEHLKGFAMVMGCEGNQIPAFMESTQRHYDSIFTPTGSDPSDLVRNVKSAMGSDKLCGYNKI